MSCSNIEGIYTDEVTKAYNKLCEYTSSELRKNGEVHITVDYLSKLFNFKNMKDVFNSVDMYYTFGDIPIVDKVSVVYGFIYLKLKEYVYKYKECGCKVLFCGDSLDIWIG